MSIKHRCEEWKDLRIHPEVNVLWGTCMEYNRGEWIINDETSGTCSIWMTFNCPFCKCDLNSLLENNI